MLFIGMYFEVWWKDGWKGGHPNNKTQMKATDGQVHMANLIAMCRYYSIYINRTTERFATKEYMHYVF